jgi:hypothetical protein
MADDGYSHITSIDYSPVAIQRLQQAYPARPQLQYAVADARAMPQYADGSFGGVLVRGAKTAGFSCSCSHVHLVPNTSQVPVQREGFVSSVSVHVNTGCCCCPVWALRSFCCCPA